MTDISMLTVMSSRIAESIRPTEVRSPVVVPPPQISASRGFLDQSLSIPLIAATISAGLMYTAIYKLSKSGKSDRNKSRPQQARQTSPQSRAPVSPSDAASPVLPPNDESASRFSKMEELGRGGFGVVYKGRHYRTGELVAIKEMPLSGCDDLKAEFDIVVGLKHENIVNIIAFETGQRHARLYLEWVAGGSLADNIKRFPIDETLARHYVRQILQGLAFLHDHNVIHRDIKPKNILIDHRGVLKLTDFGLSRHLDSMHDRTRAQGTPVYMAPECVRGQFSVGSDIWAVGATLSEMLTKALPWSHIDPQIFSNQMALLYHIASFQGHANHHPTIPSDVSTECQEFLKTCFAAIPKDRTSCVELLQHPWFAVLSGCSSEGTGLIGSTDSDSQTAQSSQRESLNNTNTFSQMSAVSK